MKYNSYFHFFLLSSLIIGFIGVVGCGDGRVKRVPISGKITIDGEPLTFGTIQFFPVKEGRMGKGSVKPDGSYAVDYYEKGDGLPKGEFKVRILAGEYVSDTRLRWHAPKKYSKRATSGLTGTIDGETESLDFELTWKDNGKHDAPWVEKLE